MKAHCCRPRSGFTIRLAAAAWFNYQLEQTGAAGLNLFAGFGELTSLDIRAPVAQLDC
jgi:hypothetical protein